MTTELEYKKPEKEVLGTVANIRYYHLAFPWNSPLSFGVQALIEFNGLVLNDRYQSDLIRVVSITGLDDAEVRDEREKKSGKSGEYPYDAFYGGRNLVMTGFIETGSLQVLIQLSIQLKAALANLEESPLKFRWFDIYDTFDDPNTILEYNPNANLSIAPSGNYIPLIGSLSDLKIESGLLKWQNTNKVCFLRASEKRTYCDVQMSMKLTCGLASSVSEIGFVLCAKNSENYVVAYYKQNTTEPSLNIEVINSGENYLLKSEVLASGLGLVTGESFWIRGRKEENNIILEFWKEQPNNEFFPSMSINTYLTGEFSEIYGSEILSQVGIMGNNVRNSWSADEFKIESLYPGDVEFMARKINFSMKDEQTSLTRFKRPFQVTMKTSDFRAFSSTQIVKSFVPTNKINDSTLGRSYPRKYPLKYNFFTSNSLLRESNLISINNRGSVYVEPIFFLYGPGENILIENLMNEQSLEWLGTINAGDYIVFNCKEETIENSLGQDYLEPLVPTVEWVKLEPMWNDIYVAGSGFGESSKFVVKTNHGYM